MKWTQPRGLVAAGGIVGALVVALIMGWPSEGHPQGMPTGCKPYAEVHDWLSAEYHEDIAGAGMRDFQGVPTGAALLLYVSENGETWTLVELRPDGTACTAGGGKNWAQIPYVPPYVPRRPS